MSHSNTHASQTSHNWSAFTFAFAHRVECYLSKNDYDNGRKMLLCAKHLLYRERERGFCFMLQRIDRHAGVGCWYYSVGAAAIECKLDASELKPGRVQSSCTYNALQCFSFARLLQMIFTSASRTTPFLSLCFLCCSLQPRIRSACRIRAEPVRFVCYAFIPLCTMFCLTLTGKMVRSGVRTSTFRRVFYYSTADDVLLRAGQR